MTDLFAYWKAALEAKQKHLAIPREKYHDGQPQKPECGYYRKRIQKRADGTCWEAIAFYPAGADGAIVCERQFGKAPTELQAQAELFATVWDEPVPFETFGAVVDHGEHWPDELDAFGLPPLDEPPENERAVMGHNEPPEKTEIDRARQMLDVAKRTVAEWIGKFPDITMLDATQGDLLSRYGVKFRELRQGIEKRRRDEVDPHVKAQREINAKWKPLIDDADAEQRRILSLWDRWRGAAEAKAAEAARKANEEAARIAEEERKKREEIDGETEAPPPPLQLVEPVKIKGAAGTRVSSRTRTVAVITDLHELVSYMAKLDKPPQDLVAAAQTFANRFAASGNLPGVRVESRPYVA